MTQGLLATMTGPYQGNILPPGCEWAADNGKFTKDGPRTNWIGHKAWFEWLEGQVDRYGAENCRFAVAPDVPFDAARTLDESLPWLEKIRGLGIPAAFAAQNGCELYGLPWDEMDVLFLAGGPTVPDGPPDTEWKISPIAQHLVIEAINHDVDSHMGRANSFKRVLKAALMGCGSADGTYLKFGPDINLPKVLAWLGRLDQCPATPLLGDEVDQPYALERRVAAAIAAAPRPRKGRPAQTRRPPKVAIPRPLRGAGFEQLSLTDTEA